MAALLPSISSGQATSGSSSLQRTGILSDPFSVSTSTSATKAFHQLQKQQYPKGRDGKALPPRQKWQPRYDPLPPLTSKSHDLEAMAAVPRKGKAVLESPHWPTQISDVQAGQLPIIRVRGETAEHQKAKSGKIDEAEDESIFYAAAVDNLQERLSAGEKEAALVLGKLHFEMGNYQSAKAALITAMKELKSIDAVYLLGIIHFEGLDGTPNPALGIEYMTHVANSRHKDALVYDAQFKLGCAYFSGCGVVANDEKCEHWWRAAAADGKEEGSVRAQTALGHWFSDRHKLNLASAFAWHKCAAENGSTQSLSSLGILYLYGLGTEIDEDLAFKCFKEAAAQGSLYAAANLVGFYSRRKLYHRAIELAQQISTFDLSGGLEEEARTPGTAGSSLWDSLDAASLQEEYARKAVAMACFYLGRCYERGLGLPHDQQQAAHYYSQACKIDNAVSSYLQSLAFGGAL